MTPFRGLCKESQVGIWEGAYQNQAWLRWWDVQDNLLLAGKQQNSGQSPSKRKPLDLLNG